MTTAPVPFPTGVGAAGLTRPRRTQSERRAATRTALLEACVDCLLEYGYPRLTTGAVACRAGVSRGARAHHFSTKAQLVVAAMQHLADRAAAELATGTSAPPTDPAGSWAELLDLLWTVHSDRVFPALLELCMAARTDTELRAALVGFERDLTHRLMGLCADRFPELAGSPDFRPSLGTALAAMRGLALVDAFGRDGERDRLWPGVRDRLLALVRHPVS